MTLNAKGKAAAIAVIALASLSVAHWPQGVALEAWLAFAFGASALVLLRGSR